MKKSFIIIFILVLGATLFYGIRYVKTPVATQVAALTKYEQKISTDAFIVKNEVVYNAKNSGTIYNYAEENSRVGKDRRIASVYDGNVNSELIKELNNIDKKIDEIEAGSQDNEFVSDSSSAENQIETRKDSIIDAAKSGNVSKIAEYKEEINNIKLGQSNTGTSGLSELKSQRSKLENSIGRSKKDIMSSISGIYTVNIDGLEDTLTPESISKYTVDDFNSLKKAEVQKSKTTVQSGEAVCKVVDNHIWYALVKLRKQEIDGYEVGSAVKLRFDDMLGVEVPAKIKYISDEVDGEVVISIECERYVDGIYNIRNSGVEIVLKSYTGYIVPIHAIRIEDNKKGVMIENRSAQLFRECDILYKDTENNTAIIYPSEDSSKKLQQMDRIVLGEKIEEKK